MENRERPHVLVIPEDDANRQIANGFLLGIRWDRQRQVRILPVAKGWQNVVAIGSRYVDRLNQFPNRFLILMIDFDNQPNRRQEVRNIIPPEFADRVFVLGTLTEPELLRPDLGSFERVGQKLANDCQNKTRETWGHNLLLHNFDELSRIPDDLLRMFFDFGAE